MDKISIIVSCPIDTYSGYGARSRDFVKALLLDKKYDVRILSQRWGNTSFGYLNDHNEDELSSLIIPTLTSKPDVWVQITVPNEFQKVGKYNIGVTAGIETTVCDSSWIIGCNNMDLVLTSSQHSKSVFEKTIYEEENKQTGVKNTLKLNTKVEVLFEGVDITKYFKSASNFDLSSIKEEFCFLFVGTWLPGDFGQDRKNIGYTIKAFLETFKNKPTQPALILKTGLGTSSHMNSDVIFKKIDLIRRSVKGKLPNIYFIDGDMNDSEVNALYNHSKVKAMICLTKGEGFGRPLLEFSTVGKPIITSFWSGHTDFLYRDFVKFIGGQLTQVHKSASSKNMILENAQWFTPDDAEVNNALKEIYKNYKKYLEPAKRQSYLSKTNFSFEAMSLLLSSILKDNLPEFPKQLDLNLPNLQPSTSNGLQTLSLPKFKV